MEIQKLKDICLTEITDGTHQTPTYSEYGYIFLSSKNVTTQKIDWDNVMFIPEKLHEELYKRVAPQIDDILLAKNGTTGVAAIVDRDIVFDIYVSLALIRPNTEIVMPRYLLYAINNPVVKGYFDSSLKGIGVPNLHLKNIRETPIKIYDLETQKAIVEKLDKVCELISLRKQQLAKLDELIKARFVEMFGDPDQNPKGWPLVSVTEIIRDKASNGFFAKRDAYKDDGNVQILGVSNVVNRMYSNTKELPRTNATQAEKEKYSVKYGDMLFCRSSLVADGIGKASIVAKGTFPNVLFECHVIRLSLDLQKCVPEFVQVLSTTPFFRRQIIAQSKTATMTTIGQDGILKSSVVLPPIDLQNQFAAFVERVDQQKQIVQQSLEKLELMKKALMQEYFG